MSAGLKALSHHDVNAGLLTLLGEFGRAYHVCNLHARLVEALCVFLWAARRGEDNLAPLFDYHVYERVYLRVHQREVHAPGLVRRRLALLYMLPEQIDRHRAGTYQAQAARITHCGSEAPAATPGHATRYDRIFYTEDFLYSIHHIMYNLPFTMYNLQCTIIYFLLPFTKYRSPLTA